jgi:hypothetical protein
MNRRLRSSIHGEPRRIAEKQSTIQKEQPAIPEVNP